QGADGDSQLHQPGRLLVQGPLLSRLSEFLPGTAQLRESLPERLIGVGWLRQRVHRASSRPAVQVSSDGLGPSDYLSRPWSRQEKAATSARRLCEQDTPARTAPARSREMLSFRHRHSCCGVAPNTRTEEPEGKARRRLSAVLVCHHSGARDTR